MADIDVFVHPISPILDIPLNRPNPGVSRSINKYLENIVREMRASSNPVLVKLPADAPAIARALEDSSLFSSIIPYRQVRSFGVASQTEYSPLGYVSYNDWKRFKELLAGATSKSDVRVHGAYFGRCVRDLSFQIYAYLRYGAHVCRSEEHEKDSVILQDLFLFKFSEITGAVKRSGIKYGVVFSPIKQQNDSNPESVLRRPSATRPFGNLHYQLIDEKTVIYNK